MDAGHTADRRGTIPFRLRVGVSGHRSLNGQEVALAGQVRVALRRIRELVAASSPTDVLLTVVSPLAEGADRLVANEVLREPGADLEAPLPLEVDDYRSDFKSRESLTEFNGLLDRATKVTVLPRSSTRDEAYRNVGEFVVDRSDVLIALWDGAQAQGAGGTAEVVAYAQSKNVPLIWISTEGPHDLTVSVEGRIAEKTLHLLDQYNGAAVRREEFSAEVEREERYLMTSAHGLSDLTLPLQMLSGWISPFYVRADLLAIRFQRWYYWLGNASFLLAAAAVAGAAGQILILPKEQGLVWIEVAVMIALLFLFLGGRKWRFHERWLACRFLAERFRSAPFLVLAGLHRRREGDLERLDLGHHSEEWLRRGFSEVWKRRPALDLSAVDSATMRGLLAEAWIGDQLNFHRSSTVKYGWRHTRLSWLIYGLFAGTILAALAHALSIGGSSEEALSWPHTFELLAIALPALGASLSGIRAQREYERNAERFHQMADYLERARIRMNAALDMDLIRVIAAEVEDQMLDENRDWFSVMKFHNFELGH